MALQSYAATINNAAVNVLGGKDASGNLIATSVPVSSAGVELGTTANPLNTAIATLPSLPTGTNVVGSFLQAGSWTVSLSPSASVALASGTTVGISSLPATLGAVTVSNFPTTQTVSVTNTPTVTNLSLGAPTDTAWTSGSGSLVALQKSTIAAIQSTTAAVTAASLVPPSPTFTGAANASSLTLKATAGSLYGCYCTSGSTNGYLMMFDATAVPSNGTVTPKHVIYCPANSTTAVTLPFLTSEPYVNGIIAVFSSTGSTTLTASTALYLKGIAQ